MRVHYFQHVPYEPPAGVAGWAIRRGHAVTGTDVFLGYPPPPPERYDALVVMGGPMSVNDEATFPWLTDEKRAVEAALAAGKPVVGVCLGAQIIAGVLGATVRKNDEPEIGWFPVRREGAAHRIRDVLPDAFTPFHWHNETFDLPAGAVHLASSEACANQMFASGDNVLAMQFHLDMGRDGIKLLVDRCGGDLGAGRFIQDPREMPSESRLHAAHDLLDSILDHFFER